MYIAPGLMSGEEQDRPSHSRPAMRTSLPASKGTSGVIHEMWGER